MLGCVKMRFFSYRHRVKLIFACIFVLCSASAHIAMADTGVFLPVSRSSLVVLPSPVKEIVIANPDIVDAYAHNQTSLTLIGKTVGSTNVRLFDGAGKLLKTLDVSVGYDLPAIRKSLKTFIPDETIGVQMVNTSIALVGNIRSNANTDKAIKIVQDYIGGAKPSGGAGASASASSETPNIINMMKLISGQQVMLRVRVAEVNRDAVKLLGIDPQVILSSGNYAVTGAVGTAMSGIVSGATNTWKVPADTYRGTMFAGFKTKNGIIGGAVNAMEKDDLVKILAEPNLVAVSGESAEFLAGGEVPIPVAQSSGGTTASTVTVDYKPYGVNVKFTPDVLSENRIRITVNPEVSEVTFAQGSTVGGLPVPSKTTVELAPGESFMIGGLLKDQTSADIQQLPGLKDLPVLGALFRSTTFQRNESELVIAVTPYLVDPLKSSDVKLPTDDFRPANQMEMFFYGTLGAITADGKPSEQTPQLEGPTGFMMD